MYIQRLSWIMCLIHLTNCSHYVSCVNCLHWHVVVRKHTRRDVDPGINLIQSTPPVNTNQLNMRSYHHTACNCLPMVICSEEWRQRPDSASSALTVANLSEHSNEPSSEFMYGLGCLWETLCCRDLRWLEPYTRTRHSPRRSSRESGTDGAYLVFG